MAITNPLLNEPTVVLKATDEVVNNSDALQNDDELLYAMAANTRYEITLYIYNQSATTTPKMKGGFTVPAGCLVAGVQWYTTTGVAGGIGNISATSLAAPWYCATSKACYLIVQFLLQNKAAAGNFQFQWAQNVATIEDTKVMADSLLIIRILPN